MTWGVLVENKEYLNALNRVSGLRKSVDDFFEGVEVMTKDSPELKENRVGVLQNISLLFFNPRRFFQIFHIGKTPGVFF